MYKRTLIAALTVATLGGTFVAAHAGTVRIENGHAVKTLTIDLADLATQPRAAKVYAKIEAVAVEVCGVDGDAPAWVLAEDQDCMQRAISSAVADLDSEALSQVHRENRRPAQAYASRDR